MSIINNQEITPDSIENVSLKKKSRGRRSFRSISKSGTFVCLLNGSKMHIEKMVKELKLVDANFTSEAAAVRHYVHIGIAAETATSDLRHSLDNSIVKRSQKDAVRAELKPHSELIKNLINAVEDLRIRSEEISSDIARRTDTIEAKLDHGLPIIKDSLDELLKLTAAQMTITKYNARQTVVLRTIFYIFLLGFKTGKIAPGEDNLLIWSSLIKIAHTKANEMSLDEVYNLPTEYAEAEVIRKLSTEIFHEVKQKEMAVK